MAAESVISLSTPKPRWRVGHEKVAWEGSSEKQYLV
jgi:hypothetical protein